MSVNSLECERGHSEQARGNTPATPCADSAHPPELQNPEGDDEHKAAEFVHDLELATYGQQQLKLILIQNAEDHALARA